MMMIRASATFRLLLLLFFVAFSTNHARMDSRRMIGGWNATTAHDAPTVAPTVASLPSRLQQQKKDEHFSWSLIGPFLSMSVVLFLMKQKCKKTKSKGEESELSPPKEVELKCVIPVHDDDDDDEDSDMYIQMEDDRSMITISTIGLESVYATH